MNSNTVSLRDRLKSVQARAVTAGSALALAGAASAQDAGFDPATITAKIVANTATGVLIIGAMILGVWTLRSMGLLKRG